MKNYLHSLFVALVATTTSLSAQTIVIDDGFEQGIQETEWTQEFVSGNMPWAVESVEDGLAYPATAFQGTHRAYLRNTTGETQGYVTRLVSKVMDLSPRVIYQPELTFWYANPRWGKFNDTLRVLYRTNTNAKWKKLGTYTNTPNWQKVTLELPELTTTYQIAFEGIENMGHGIVLDSIKLRSAPDCTVPHHIAASNKGFDRVKISWNASYDSEFFELIVSKDSIDPYKVDEVDASRIAYHDRLNGRQKNITLTLESGEYYYVYVRSICEREISVWSNEINPNGSPFGFRVRATKFIPYTCDFNYPNTQTQDVEWTWANNFGKMTPYVYSTTNASELAKYSQSHTPAVIFSGGTASATNVTAPKTVIPAGKYAYLATPTLTDTMNANFSLSQCQVRFWSTVHQYTGRLYAHSVIVGVMDDPDDITTFVPVDTVSIWGYNTHVESIVDLSSYRGTGAYVAFLSRYEQQNLFYIDDVTVEYISQAKKVTEISVNPRDTYADITWKGNASSYNVLITSEEVDPSNPTASVVVDRATVSTNSYHCTALEQNHSWNRPYYVYVQAVGADWSYRYPFVTIASKRALPYTFDFEAASGTYKIGNTSYSYPSGLGIFGNNPSYPSLSTSKHYKGSQCLYLDKNIGTDAWITLPLVERMDTVQIKFFLSGPTSYSQAHATIGVMTNPMDINTFIPVSDFTLNTAGFSMCYANFLNYHGPDGVIAIVWSDVAGMTQKTVNYIDELRIEELAECLPPVNVTLDVESDSITLNWNASREEEWEVLVSTAALTTAQKDKSFAELAALGSIVYADTLTWNQPEKAPMFGIGGLQSQMRYFLYVRTLCHGDMAWWTEYVFRTPCPDAQFPFMDDFENYGVDVTQIDCWQLKNYIRADYPKIVKLEKGNGTKQLELVSQGSTHRSVAILPPIEGDLSSRLLSFNMQSRDKDRRTVLYVGTMRDIDDANTFIPFETIYNEKNDTNHVVRLFLSKYNLAYDNIAISTGLGDISQNSDVLIDNIEVRDTSCVEAFDFQVTDVQTNAFDIAWSGVSTGKQWKVTVLKTELSLDMVRAQNYPPSFAIVTDSLVVGNALHIEGLEPIHPYYIYIRPVCEERWNVTTVKTACALLDPTYRNLETFNSYPDNGQADCWTAHNAFIYKFGSTDNKAYKVSPSSLAGDNRGCLVSPEIDCKSMSQLTVSFSYWAGGSVGCSMVLGVMTNPDDKKSFVALDTIRCQTSKSAMLFDLSDYADKIPNGASYFAWATMLGESSSVSFYVDDVDIEKLTCPLSQPSYSNLSAHSVHINNNSGLDNDWALLITSRPVPSLDTLRTATYVVPPSILVCKTTVSSPSKVVTDLEYDKQYYVYTATLCDDGVSLWSETSFRTLCAAETPEDLGIVTFAGERMKCWTVGSKTLNATSNYIPSIGSSRDIMHKGNNYLQIHDEFSESVTSVGAYAIMQEIDVDMINKYQVNFWGRGYSNNYSSYMYNSQIIVGVVTDPTDLSTFVAADTVNLSSSWEPFSVTFEQYMGDYMGNRGRYIMFLSEFGKTNYAYLSEISVTPIPECRPVSSFTIDSVGEYAAVVSWKGYSDSYRLLVADRELEDYEVANYHYLRDSIVNHSDRVLINDLNAATDYYVYVQGICSPRDRSAISLRYAAFRTECPIYAGLSLPFFDDFQRYADNDRNPGCWMFRNEKMPNNFWPCIDENTSNASIPKDLRQKYVCLHSNGAGHSWIVVPKVEERLQNLRLSFDARHRSSSDPAILYIGTMSDPDDLMTFVPIERFSLPAEDKFQHHEMILADYDLPYKYLAFATSADTLSTSESWVYLDNVRLESYSNCHAPKVKLVKANYTTADLEIIPTVEDNQSWELVTIVDSVYAQINDIQSYLDTVHGVITADDIRLTISGLQEATTYYIFARTSCGDDIYSVWSKYPLKIKTRYYYNEGYFFGFEKDEPWQRSQYSTGDNYYIHPALLTGRDNMGNASSSVINYPYSTENTSALLYAYTGTGALSIQSTKEYYGSYVIFPPAEEPHARSFEFKVRPASIRAATHLPAASYDAKLEIGTVDKDMGFETYQVLATIDIAKLDGSVEATAENNYLYSFYTLDLDSALVATKQLVLHAPKQPDVKSYLYLDDVEMGTPKGFSLVSFDRIAVGGDRATIYWKDLGGPWNLYVIDASNDTIARYYDLRTTSQLVEGLEAQTYYTAVLEAVDVPSGIQYITSASRKFLTACRALEPTAQGEFYWNFDDQSDWEANDILEGRVSDSLYLKPACFKVGIPYAKPANGYQWLVQRKGSNYTEAPLEGALFANYEVGRDNTNAMRIFTDAEHIGSYLVLPELNCDFDTMMIEFYGRCFANYDEDYAIEPNRGKIVDASYLGLGYSHSIVVGTMTDPNDFGTLEIIDTISYRQNQMTATDNVNNDPSGLRYWEQMQMPLTGAQGKYLVLFQPSEGLFFIDDLSIKPIGNTLFAPTSLHVDAITMTSADMSWHAWHPNLASVVVVLDAMGSNEIIRDTVAGNTYIANGLNGGTSYQVYVYQTDGMRDGEKSASAYFSTECASITPTYTCGFEIEDGWSFVPDQDIQSSIQSLCWTYGDAANDAWTRSYDAENIRNTERLEYSYNGSYAVLLRGERSGNTTYQPYIAMPAMDIAAYDTLQVTFRMRPAHLNALTGKVAANYSGGIYSKSIIVGTMTDPNDAATFVPIDTVTYNDVLSIGAAATATNDYLFQKKRVALAGATGQYIAFMSTFREKGAKIVKDYNYIYLDDVAFSRRQDCAEPSNLSTVFIGSVSAAIEWDSKNPGNAYLLQVSSNPYFESEAELVFNDTVYSNNFVVEGLQASTSYVWRVQRICGDNESEYSPKTSFSTIISPYYLENFDAVLKGTWIFGNTPVNLDTTIIATEVKVGMGSSRFSQIAGGAGLPTTHYAAMCIQNNFDWMVSPAFYLPENDSVHLSLDLALTACVEENGKKVISPNVASETDMRKDHYFMIVISDDAGKTWKRENIIAKWQNDLPQGQQLRDIPSDGMNVRLSLARYAGKSIRVGLYREAVSNSPGGIAIHVDNFRLGYYDRDVNHLTGCEYEDIEQGDVFISGEDVHPGINTYATTHFATDEQAKNGVHDMVDVLEVEVYPIAETTYYDTICEGKAYVDLNFPNGKTQTGIYPRRLQTVEGCDSIVYLNLHVTPTMYAEEKLANVCRGDSLLWNGKYYHRAGLYRDTTVSSTGCDSVEILLISYWDAEDTVFTATTITVDELPFTYTNVEYPYVIGQAPIFYPVGTAPGEYKDTVMVQGVTCSAALVHTLTIKAHDGIEEISTDKRGARKVLYRDNMYIILNDEWYNVSGQRVSDPRK